MAWDSAVPDAAIRLIKKYEGFESSPYVCPGNKLTVGYGHIVKDNKSYGGFTGKHIHRVYDVLDKRTTLNKQATSDLRKIFPDLINEEQASTLLIEDAAPMMKNALRLVHVKLNASQRAAICSFVFNLGVWNFEKSTLLKKLNNKDYRGAADEFLRWVHAGGQRLKGLERRRQEERELFLMKVVS